MKWWQWVIIIATIIGVIYILYRLIMKPLKYFDWSEFDSPDAPGSGKRKFNKVTASKLDEARHYIEKNWNKNNPSKRIIFKINSAYRTVSHNQEVGGVSKSAHLDKGSGAHAVDISWSNYNLEQKKEMVRALWKAGFRRFGTANSFLHVDDDQALKQFAYWGYPSGNPAIFNIEALVA